MSENINASNPGAVWVLEDDDQMRRILKSLLQSYRCLYFKTLKDFNSEWKRAAKKPVLLLADLSLPDGSFLNWMETNGSFKVMMTKCIVISGQQDIGYMRVCLDLGALDYIVKPFVPAEVQIKVERVFQGLKLPLVLNPTTHSVGLDLKDITLTSKQFQILSLLHMAYPLGVTRLEIQIWFGKTRRLMRRPDCSPLSAAYKAERDWAEYFASRRQLYFRADLMLFVPQENTNTAECRRCTAPTINEMTTS